MARYLMGSEAKVARTNRLVVFCVVIIGAGAIAVGSSNSVYASGWWVTLLVGIAISWAPMNLLALVLEHRVLRPSEQFWQFYLGDLIGLPIAMASLAVLQGRLGHKTWNPGWWFWVCLVIAVVFGIAFHWGVDKPKPGGYTEWEWESPTKLWHDLFVFPAFWFYLLYRFPLLWSPTSWTHSTAYCVLVVVGVAFWFVLMFVDSMRDPNLINTAHPEYDWANWRSLSAS